MYPDKGMTRTIYVDVLQFKNMCFYIISSSWIPSILSNLEICQHHRLVLRERLSFQWYRLNV